MNKKEKEGDSIDPLCFPNAEDYLNDFDTANQVLLGSGSYGQVYKMQFKSNPNLQCAVKIVQCVNKKSYESALREVQMNRQINIHPNIIYFDKIYAWSETIPVQKYFLVLQMKLAKGSLKDLKDDEIKANKKTFNDASFINLVNQLLEAFIFLQKKELYHRDIKPENILYEIENEKIIMRIADFGVSKALEHFKANNVKNTLVGTPLYLSPKLWEAYIGGQYNDVKHNLEKSDVFSLGVTLIQTYLLLSDQQISGLNDQKQNKVSELLQKISNEKIKQLLAGMLIYDEKQRFSWLQALNIVCEKQENEQNTINGASIGQKEKHYVMPISYEKTISNKLQTIKLKKIHQIIDAQDQIKGQIADEKSITIYTETQITSLDFDGVVIFNKKVQQVKQICYTDQPKKVIVLFENNTLQIIDEDLSTPVKIIEKGQITSMVSMKEQNIVIGLSNGFSQVLQVEQNFKVLNALQDHTAQINLLFFDKIQQILVTSDITRIFSVRYILEGKFSYLKLDYVAQHVEIMNENQLIVNGQNLSELLILQIKQLKQTSQIKLEIKQTLNLQTGSVLSLINLSERCLFVSSEKEIIIYDISSLASDQNHLIYNESQQNLQYCNWIQAEGYLITSDGQRIQKWEVEYKSQKLYGLNRLPYIQKKRCGCSCCQGCVIM